MNQKFERVARHLYQRKYRAAAGDWTTLYYARFVCKLKGKKRIIRSARTKLLPKANSKSLRLRTLTATTSIVIASE